ncbi:hypothetical protein PFFCH_05551 [Plasmodium falciparum FCH/4]|uniref:Uncharacterized protein n=1 Tax=Plasmodium falciparum FCH/4 TaxID=1036724 RepID=A0A024VGI9_PLAFA|nr:hypothetical protein PFFCH_05551 [Plasmodium falciparum FCH/4]
MISLNKDINNTYNMFKENVDIFINKIKRESLLKIDKNIKDNNNDDEYIMDNFYENDFIINHKMEITNKELDPLEINTQNEFIENLDIKKKKYTNDHFFNDADKMFYEMNKILNKDMKKNKEQEFFKTDETFGSLQSHKIKKYNKGEEKHDKNNEEEKNILYDENQVYSVLYSDHKIEQDIQDIHSIQTNICDENNIEQINEENSKKGVRISGTDMENKNDMEKKMTKMMIMITMTMTKMIMITMTMMTMNMMIITINQVMTQLKIFRLI